MKVSDNIFHGDVLNRALLMLFKTHLFYSFILKINLFLSLSWLTFLISCLALTHLKMT